MGDEVVIRGPATGFVQTAEVGRHRFVVDEPAALGGTDAGPTPYALLLAALGACTSMTVGLYARRKGWPLADVTVRLVHDRVHAADCADCPDQPRLLDRITVEVTLVGPLDDAQRARLLEIAARCPVHKTLVSDIEIVTRAG